MPRAGYADVGIEVARAASPGHAQRANRAKYLAMQAALLGVLQNAAPVATIAEAKMALQVALPGHFLPASHQAEGALEAAHCYVENAARIARDPPLPAGPFKQRPGG